MPICVSLCVHIINISVAKHHNIPFAPLYVDIYSVYETHNTYCATLNTIQACRDRGGTAPVAAKIYIYTHQILYTYYIFMYHTYCIIILCVL